MSHHDSHHSSSSSSLNNGGSHPQNRERSPSSHHGGSGSGGGGHSDRRYNNDNNHDRRLSSRDYDRRRDSYDNNRNNERRLTDSRGHEQHSNRNDNSRYDRRLSDSYKASSSNSREDGDDYQDNYKRSSYNNNNNNSNNNYSSQSRNNDKRYYNHQRDSRDGRDSRDNRDNRDGRDNRDNYNRSRDSGRDNRDNNSSYHGKRSYKDYEDYHQSDRYNNNNNRGGSRNYPEKPPASNCPPIPPEDPEPKYGPLTEAFTHLTKTINDYSNIRKLGEGTYGEVYQARLGDKPGFVAAKKMRSDLSKEKQAGFPITTIREIKILRELNHENIVKLLDISWDDKSFFMIFEFVDHDLAGLSEMGIKFSESHLRFFMYQLIDALYYCHSSNVYHRDLKTSNILIRRDGVLKLADFGLSLFKKRTNNNYTNKVVTRWYRAPDVLLGSTSYGASIDMWSVGCIFGELLLRERALFMGENEPDQLVQIFNCCGTPDLEDWPEVVELPEWQAAKPTETIPNTLRRRFRDVKCSEKALDLLERLLTLNPKKRITAKEALSHEWFFEDGHPLSHNPKLILPRETTNELTAKNARPANYQRSSGAADSSRRYERGDHQPPHKKQR